MSITIRGIVWKQNLSAEVYHLEAVSEKSVMEHPDQILLIKSSPIVSGFLVNFMSMLCLSIKEENSSTVLNEYDALLRKVKDRIF